VEHFHEEPGSAARHGTRGIQDRSIRFKASRRNSIPKLAALIHR
jgi:hypothetical protein